MIYCVPIDFKDSEHMKSKCYQYRNSKKLTYRILLALFLAPHILFSTVYSHKISWLFSGSFIMVVFKRGSPLYQSLVSIVLFAAVILLNTTNLFLYLSVYKISKIR